MGLKSFILGTLQKLLWKKKWALVGFIQRPNFSRLYEQIALKERTTALEINEMFNVYSAVISTEKIPGDIAEVGVFKGASAKIICSAKDTIKSNKKVHLFDTFEGLPEVKSIDTKWNKKSFKKGQFNCSLESVKAYLKRFSNIYFYRGLFPGTSDPVKSKKFSLVHLDVDLYQSTKDSLEFFYPRMSKGGIIISHDYPFAKGVKKAFDDFFKDKPEPIISLMNKQAMIVKI